MRKEEAGHENLDSNLGPVNRVRRNIGEGTVRREMSLAAPTQSEIFKYDEEGKLVICRGASRDKEERNMLIEQRKRRKKIGDFGEDEKQVKTIPKGTIVTRGMYCV